MLFMKLSESALAPDARMSCARTVAQGRGYLGRRRGVSILPAGTGAHHVQLTLPKAGRLLRHDMGWLETLTSIRQPVRTFSASTDALLGVDSRPELSTDLGVADISTHRGPALGPSEAALGEPEELCAGQYQWSKQWYPVVPVEYLDATRPHPFTLLGRDVVLWRDGTATWRCFEDVCPHRQVPLSEGRIEADGNLLCAYHAWRFDGSGKCVAVPQARDKEDEARICSNERSCARAHPTKVIHGLLWVWGENGPAAVLESTATAPRVIEELLEENEKVVQAPWSFRDLPHGAEYFFENVLDPAHVPVSHHKLAGDRYKHAKYIEPVLVEDVTKDDGFTLTSRTRAGNMGDSSMTYFRPPCLVRTNIGYNSGGALALVLYATPTKPGWCRHVGCQVLTKREDGSKPKGLAFFAQSMPPWLLHATSSMFLHQDLAFLHYQEKKASAIAGGADRPKKYFMPIHADRGVMALRKWLDRYSGGNVHMAVGDSNGLPPPLGKEQLFDVYSSHTRHCATCQKALAQLHTARTAALAAGVLALLTAAVVTATACSARAAALVAGGMAVDAAGSAALLALPPGGALLALALAALTAAAAVIIQRLIALFYRYDFAHPDNN